MAHVSAPTAPGRPFVPLLAVSLLTGVGYALAFPFLSLFLVKELGASPFATGAFLLSGAMSSLVVSTLIGRLSDARAVRRNLMVVASLAGATGYALFAVVRNYWLLLVVSIALLSVASVLMPQLFAYARQVLERSGSTRAPLAISALRTMMSVSWVGGPPLAALLIDVSGFVGLFGAAAVICLLGAGVTAFLLDEPGLDEATRGAGGGGGLRRDIAFAAVAFTLLQGASQLGVIAMPLFIADVLHGSTSDAGLVLGLCAALEIPLMLGLGALGMRVDLRRIVLAGGAVALAYYAVMLMTTATWQVLAAQLLHATVISAVMGVGISFFQDIAPDRPGYATTLYTNTMKVSGMLSGPLLALSAVFGYRSAYAIGLVMSVLGVAFLVAARRR
ncbi:sugar efflux transporter [Saccharothrix sp. NPDC042600]|uniref:sugar efflux transporter n=1 Tax=Saccharothrix TaxID=2071 RepID=UPI0033F61F8D|nr:sugar efflux transporter SetB [Saccharothrix mutabilis subsp. capreolus]